LKTSLLLPFEYLIAEGRGKGRKKVSFRRRKEEGGRSKGEEGKSALRSYG